MSNDQIQKMHAIYNKLYKIQSNEIYQCLVRHEVCKPMSDDQRSKFIDIVSTILGSGDSKNMKKKTKKKKDPNAPKRPPSSGYFIWLNSNRKMIKQLILDEGENRLRIL